MTDQIRVEYKTLDEIATTFNDEAERVRQIFDILTTSTKNLKYGGWEGDNANTHFRAMDDDILPSMKRLADALFQAADATLQIKAIYQQAEQEAAARLFGETENTVNELSPDDGEKDLRPRYQLAVDFTPRDPETPAFGEEFINLTALTEGVVPWWIPPEDELTEEERERQRRLQEYLEQLFRQTQQGVFINRPPTEEELGIDEESRRRQEEEFQRFLQSLRGPLINDPPTEEEIAEAGRQHQQWLDQIMRGFGQDDPYVLMSDDGEDQPTDDVPPSNQADNVSPHYIRIDPEVPGRPDPDWSIDTANFDPDAPTASETRHGEILDQTQFWSQWRELDEATGRETLSERNIRVIEAGYSPIVDSQWVEDFPEHAPFMGQTIEHHHVNFGQYAIPLPRELHRGSGNSRIWHTQ